MSGLPQRRGIISEKKLKLFNYFKTDHSCQIFQRKQLFFSTVFCVVFSIFINYLNFPQRLRALRGPMEGGQSPRQRHANVLLRISELIIIFLFLILELEILVDFVIFLIDFDNFLNFFEF